MSKTDNSKNYIPLLAGSVAIFIIILIILISMMSGGGGSGKSHTTRTIIKYDLEQKVDKLNESLNQYNVQLSNLQGLLNTKIKGLETRVEAIEKKVNPTS